MNILCSQTILNDIVNVVSKAVSARSSLPVLEGICIRAKEDGKITLLGNDLEIAIEAEMEAEVKEPGEIVLNAKIFSGIIKALPLDEVSIFVDDSNLTTIKSGNAKFEIMGIETKEFPEIPVVNSDYSISISKNILKDMISKTIFSVSQREDKPTLRGCLFEVEDNNIKMVAIDGCRMALRKYEFEKNFENKSMIIPEKALSEISKILKDEDDEVIINCTRKNAIFIFDNYKMVTRLIEGEFINYRSIISTDFETEIVCPIKELMNSVNRASLIITNDVNRSPVCFKIGDENINISCETSVGSVDDNINVHTGNSSLEIGFDNNYLLDALRACNGDMIKISFNKSVNPMVITPDEGDEFLYLILPIKLR